MPSPASDAEKGSRERAARPEAQRKATTPLQREDTSEQEVNDKAMRT
jgi:hypothetical protein